MIKTYEIYGTFSIYSIYIVPRNGTLNRVPVVSSKTLSSVLFPSNLLNITPEIVNTQPWLNYHTVAKTKQIYH